MLVDTTASIAELVATQAGDVVTPHLLLHGILTSGALLQIIVYHILLEVYISLRFCAVLILVLEPLTKYAVPVYTHTKVCTKSSRSLLQS